MKRREFITLIGGAAAWPLVARAQQLSREPRVGFLGIAPASAWTNQIKALRAGLRDFGYFEGRNITIEWRWATGIDELPQIIKDLIRSNVDLIVAPASTQVEPARQATTTIPIIFAQHADPINTGHVASLARPGGNITGVSMMLTEMTEKGLDVLLQVVPRAKRVGIMWNPTTPSHVYVLKALEPIAGKLGVQLVMAPVRTVSDFINAFVIMKRESVEGFVVPSSPLTNSEPSSLAKLALEHRLPGIFTNKANVEVGGFMSYGADFNYMYHRTAYYIAKVLRGDQPANLPVEQATKFELVINLKTAKFIGVDVPPMLIGVADEVIE